MSTEDATSARSGNGGATATDAPVSRATSSHSLASESASAPLDSMYVLKFTTMTGVRNVKVSPLHSSGFIRGSSFFSISGLVVYSSSSGETIPGMNGPWPRMYMDTSIALCLTMSHSLPEK